MIRIFQQDNPATKFIFGVIIAAAIVTMVITLVPGIFSDDTANNSTVYATVRTPGVWGRLLGGSTPISMQEVQQQTQRQMQQQHLPDYAMPFLINRVGQQQVERAVLVREADRLGLQVSDDDLRRELQTGPLAQYLFPGGKFIGDQQYMNFVEQFFGLGVAQFEKEVKEDLELQRLQSLVTASVSVSDSAVRSAYLQQGEKVKFNYAVISSEDIKKTINPSDAELQAFFKQNAAHYTTAVPETRKIQFIAFDDASLPGGKPQVSESEIQTYYNAHPDQFKVPEE